MPLEETGSLMTNESAAKLVYRKFETNRQDVLCNNSLNSYLLRMSSPAAPNTSKDILSFL